MGNKKSANNRFRSGSPWGTGGFLPFLGRGAFFLGLPVTGVVIKITDLGCFFTEKRSRSLAWQIEDIKSDYPLRSFL
jgi:hypothetical protein